MAKKKSKADLFVELSKPNEQGVSKWVSVSEFTGDYKSLVFGNGGDWVRSKVLSSNGKKYTIETRKDTTKRGNPIVFIRLNGFSQEAGFNQNIRSDIKKHYAKQKCVMLGVAGVSEIDHKDGRKNDERVSNPKTQTLDDFQPLCKAANDIKRQICKRCKETNKRWDAKNIKGNPYSFYEGDINYTEELKCVGCYQYDPVEYRKEAVRKISKEASLCYRILRWFTKAK
ncbi:MAG: hypothetical protein SNH57_03445 [Rikenellaceae bacterium]